MLCLQVEATNKLQNVQAEVLAAIQEVAPDLEDGSWEVVGCHPPDNQWLECYDCLAEDTVDVCWQDVLSCVLCCSKQG